MKNDDEDRKEEEEPKTSSELTQTRNHLNALYILCLLRLKYL
jgi:hypothetical protein